MKVYMRHWEQVDGEFIEDLQPSEIQPYFEIIVEEPKKDGF